MTASRPHSCITVVTIDDHALIRHGIRLLLLKNEQKLTPADRERLQALSESHPDLFRLWNLRQALHDWYEERTTPE